MSESVGLGECDAESRWIGVRRHQALLVVLGVGLAGDWLISPHSPIAVGVLGVVLLGCAVPFYDALTLGESAVVVARYVLRSHWSRCDVRALGDDVVLWSEGEVAFRSYELAHRGRLDLSGRDVTVAEGLASLADAASASRHDQHISQHVLRRSPALTVLSLPLEVPVPDGWTMRTEVIHELLGLRADDVSLRLLERFSYVRTPTELLRTFRVRDFSSVPATRALLEGTLRSATPFDLALHVEVVSGVKAQRVASRAVHRVGSDEATSRAAGFRRSARSSRNFERLAQREAIVASGRSLLRVGVFIVVHGATIDQLRENASAVWRHAHDAGLRLERGWGRQARLHRAQLPGGPGW